MSYIHINVLMFPAQTSAGLEMWIGSWTVAMRENHSHVCTLVLTVFGWFCQVGWEGAAHDEAVLRQPAALHPGSPWTPAQVCTVSLSACSSVTHSSASIKSDSELKKITYNFLLRVAFRDSVVQPVNDEWMNPCSLWSQVQPQCRGPGPSAVPHLRLLHSGISRPLQ